MARAVSSKSTNGAGCLIAFFAVFALIGSLSFVFAFLLPAISCVRAKNWVATPCRIASSTVATRGSGKDRYYYPDILYTYTANGQSYDATRFNFFKRTSKNPGTVQGWLNAYPAGSTVTCFVNPSDPSQAVLDRSFPSSAFGNFFVLIFVAVGIGGIVWQVLARRAAARNVSKGRQSWLPKKPLTLKNVNQPPVEADVQQSGPVVLKPVFPPGGVACGLFFFALIWNGFVGVFMFAGPLRSSGGGIGSIFLLLFCVPFVLVGLGVIVAAFSSLGSTFVQRPKLTASSIAVPLGSTFELDWEMQRGKINPQKMQMFLEAREEATYSRGTNTYTDRNVFLSQLLLEDASNSQRGHTRITIPADSMHSFEAARNKVVWAIKVKGDVRLWPNFEDEYRLHILPAARSADTFDSASSISP
jgi:hypothetical protein